MTIPDAEKRLGVRLDMVMVASVDQVLAKMKHDVEEKVILSTKEEFYKWIVQYVDMEGYPTKASAEFKEANISDLVFSIIASVLFDFKQNTGRVIRLEREKESPLEMV